MVIFVFSPTKSYVGNKYILGRVRNNFKHGVKVVQFVVWWCNIVLRRVMAQFISVSISQLCKFAGQGGTKVNSDLRVCWSWLPTSWETALEIGNQSSVISFRKSEWERSELKSRVDLTCWAHWTGPGAGLSGSDERRQWSRNIFKAWQQINDWLTEVMTKLVNSWQQGKYA